MTPFGEILDAWWRTTLAFVWILVLIKIFGRVTEAHAVAVTYAAFFLGSLTPWFGVVAGRMLRRSVPRMLLIAAVFLHVFRRRR